VTDDLSSANFTADGLMGMGNGEPPSVPIVMTLFSQGQITSAVIAFKLASPGSELTIGGLNPNLYSGTPIYTPVLGPGSWAIQFPVFTVGNTTITGGLAFLSSVRLKSTLLFFMLINLNRVTLSSLALQTQWMNCTPRSPAPKMRAPLLVLASTLSLALQLSLPSPLLLATSTLEVR